VQHLHESRRSLLDAAIFAIALLLFGSGLLFFISRWLELHRTFEEAAYMGIYAAAGAFALFLALAAVLVFVSYLSGMFHRRGNRRPSV
jgi:hypothetical protein